MALSDKKINAIKDLLILGRLTQTEIGEKFGISRSQVSNIATGRSYADVGSSMEVPACRHAGRLQRTPEEHNLYLIGENRRLRDHLSRVKRQMELGARHTYTIDSFITELSPVIQNIKPPKIVSYKALPKPDIQESAVLLLSDLHADSVVHPEEVDFLENYNFAIAVQRANHLVQEVIKWCGRSMTNFNFQELVILGLGDYTNGEIHRAENYFGDQFTSDLAIGELIGCMVADLSAHFPNIRFANVTGNHGRTSQKVEFDKHSVNHNHDTLIARIAEMYCRDLTNVSWEFPKSLSTIVPIRGYNFHLSHGHGKRTASAIWSRAETASVKTNSLHGGKIDYFCTGHFHTAGDVKVSGGAGLLANGAFLACDQYSYQSLQECGVPSQLLFGVHGNNGATWRLPIDMRCCPNQENRYVALERFYV